MERISSILVSIAMIVAVGYPTYLAWFRPNRFLEVGQNRLNISDDIRLHLVGRGLGTMLLIISFSFLLMALFS